MAGTYSMPLVVANFPTQKRQARHVTKSKNERLFLSLFPSSSLFSFLFSSHTSLMLFHLLLPSSSIHRPLITLPHHSLLLLFHFSIFSSFSPASYFSFLTYLSFFSPLFHLSMIYIHRHTHSIFPLLPASLAASEVLPSRALIPMRARAAFSQRLLPFLLLLLL